MAKILIVDDSDLSRRMMRKILESEDHLVIEAKDGFAALESFSLEKPDLVMLDLTMKEMAGLDVLEKLMQIDRNAKVIIASADIQSSTKAMALKAGAFAFVNKPFVADEVLKTVNSVTGEKKS